MLLLSTPAITIVTLKCDGFNANYVGENLKTITLLSPAPNECLLSAANKKYNGQNVK